MSDTITLSSQATVKLDWRKQLIIARSVLGFAIGRGHWARAGAWRADGAAKSFVRSVDGSQFQF
jgi:hypothetical protein